MYNIHCIYTYNSPSILVLYLLAIQHCVWGQTIMRSWIGHKTVLMDVPQSQIVSFFGFLVTALKMSNCIHMININQGGCPKGAW